MNRIQLLDNLTINKIAAGEVVERPSSVVKELIENSIDAGADSITVEVKDGGTTFIKISDNGSGIARDQVKTAFLRHATSKIQFVEDLERVCSLGFRGEALASIAAVSQVEIITRTADDESGVRLKIDGGSYVSQEDAAATTGTSITVKNLFYNVPARKKFLKKPAVESGYITDVVHKAALGHPEVSIKYINNGNLMLATTGNDDLRSVALYVFGKDFSKKMLNLDFKDKTYALYGLVGKPELSRANRSYEYLFINGRSVKSPIVSSAVEEAFKTRLMGGKFPVFILDLRLDLTLVDVNVHPAKLEVRFNNDTEIFDFVYKAVSKRLEEESLIPESSWDGKNSKDIKDFLGILGVEKTPEGKQESLQESTVPNNTQYKKEDIFKLDSPRKEDYPTTKKSGYRINPVYKTDTVTFEKSEENANVSKIDSLLSYNKEKNGNPPYTAKQERAEYIKNESEKQPFFNNYKIIGQIFSTYWMIEQGESVFIIDQHAAHERVLFEEFMNKLKAENVASQRLISPEEIVLSDREKTILEANLSLFNRLGFDIENDNGKFMLTSVPFIFKNPVGTGFLTDIIDILGENALDTIYDTKLDSIATMACKAAVKGNDKLSFEEAENLIKRLLTLVNPFTCPHGRPTIIELTKYELEKKFKRIV